MSTDRTAMASGISPRTGRRIGRRLLHAQTSVGEKPFHCLGGTFEFDRAREARTHSYQRFGRRETRPPVPTNRGEH
jgi:hypothetical protein